MMELYDIVDVAGSLLKEGTLVLHRSMKVHPTFKVYKKFCYDLYKVVGKSKELLFHYEENKNVPADDVAKVWPECDKAYLEWFIKWISGDEYKALKRDGV